MEDGRALLIDRLRRRKNDGALNRVPSDFYPKVWALLTKSSGIRIENVTMHSEPCISESTAEEFNFALQVEHLLDNIRDPAERQVAVECLVIITGIEERNPEVKISRKIIDISLLINDAISLFWKDWVSGHSERGVSTIEESIISVTDQIHYSSLTETISINHTSELSRKICSPKLDIDLSLSKNQKLARRLFFDVPQEGEKGTSNYLATCCTRDIFGIKLY
jgi:hypothetical protein